ncbi:MAG: hypothetical protein HKN20_02105 [Gemmatimonadetes bacterium]|nr:hypothetical protein [Gemmatimonadota bacterium]
MSAPGLKLAVRRFVLATSFPPFLALYLGIYKAVTTWALRAIRRHPHVEAVYLRRGGAKGRIVPLVSDIDFAVIGGPFPEEEERALRRAYDRLAHITTLLDRTLEIYTEEELRALHERNDYFRFRFIEGKATWKLLYSRTGSDPVAALPDMDITALHGGFANEVKVWWSLFAWRFFHDRKYNAESVTRNSFCFKTMSEALKMDLALTRDFLTFDREEALAKAMPGLEQNEQTLGARLLASASRGFRGDIPGVLEETHAFLIRHLNDFYARLGSSHSFAAATGHDARPGHRVTQRVVPGRGVFSGAREEAHGKSLDEWLDVNWGPGASDGTKLAPAAYFNLDEFGFFIPIDPENAPTVERIAALNHFHATLAPDLRARFRVYLRTPEAAFQIDTHDLEQSWQSVLTPFNNPDVFEILDGRDDERPAWTRPVAHFFEEEKFLFYELVRKPSIYKLNDRDFLRIFWKTAQLALLNRTAAEGEVVYAMTPAALVEALEAAGMALPAELSPLGPAYEAAVSAGDRPEGADSVVAPLVRGALGWLEGIDS